MSIEKLSDETIFSQNFPELGQFLLFGVDCLTTGPDRDLQVRFSTDFSNVKIGTEFWKFRPGKPVFLA